MPGPISAIPSGNTTMNENFWGDVTAGVTDRLR
jgi:hypothetical protein